MKRLGGQVNPRYDKEAERLVGRTQNAVWNISGYVISKKPSTVCLFQNMSENKIVECTSRRDVVKEWLSPIKTM